MSRKLIVPTLILAFVISACSLFGTATPTAFPTAVPTTPAGPTAAPGSPTAVPPTAIPNPTDTVAVPNPPPAPTNTTASSPTSPSNSVTDPAAANYVDDRSTPSQVIVSFYNAINRHEYSRAYGYYTSPASTAGSFTAFQNGYTNTVSVTLNFGQITSEGAAGSIYFTLPVILNASESGNVQSTYAVCYVVRQVQPGNFGAPPFQPMGIDSGTGKKVTAGTDPNSACSGQNIGPNPVSATGESLSIDKSNFVDNRSGALETVSSLLNAINLKQYARAYSYFQDASTFPGPYAPYAAGYANTDVITAIFGSITSEGAAGSVYYKVPLAMKVLTTSSATQTFVGCYTLRLGQPANQSVPPFQPLGITTGKFSLVGNDADVNSMLPSVCNQ